MRAGSRAAGFWIARILLLAVGLASWPSLHLRAETAYVSDELTIRLRTAPGADAEIQPAGLRSGAVLEVLSRQAEGPFVEVRTQAGQTGWVHQQYLSMEPIARMRLAETEAEIVALKAQSPAACAAGQAEAQAQATCEQALTEQQTVLAEVTEENESLRAELDQIRASQDADARAREPRLMLTGAGILILGMIAGFIVTVSVSRRSGKRDGLLGMNPWAEPKA